MKLAHNFPRRTSRAAFTLVELLVVIAIIIVLASLLLAAVFKALDLANEAATRTDVTQLSAAVQSFQTKYQVNYVPSRIILCKDYLNYFNNRDPRQGAITLLHQDSLDYLTRVFPRLTTIPGGQTLPQWALPPFPVWAGSPQPGNIYTGIDWNQNNVPDQLMPVLNCNGYMLEGEQCLVFFVGGIPANSGTLLNPVWTATGFSTNATNPAAGGDRVAPFFEFKSNRLVSIPGTFPIPAGQPSQPGLGFPSYVDGYGKTPYAYFSSYKTANGYNRYYGIPNPYLPPPNPSNPPYSNPPWAPQIYYSDCQALRFPPGPPLPPGVLPQPQGVWPYAQSWSPTIQYWNSQTFQIISAGKNVQFGLGTYPLNDPNYSAGVWAPSQATLAYPVGSDGYDDISNFYDRLLGVPTQ